jgi:uncharacterized protein YbaP (TraB family)
LDRSRAITPGRRPLGSWLRGLVCALLVVGSAGALAQPPKPLLWKVSDGDNHLYLLGSFHALKAADYPPAPALLAAFADAEIVAFEISPAEMRSPELPRKLMAAAALPAGQTLEQSLSGRNRLRLHEYAQRTGLPLQSYQGLEPWFVSLVISLKEMALVGYDSSLGLDQYLISRSAEAGKRTLGLETADQQIAALDSMNALEQQQSLAESLDQAADFKTEIDRLHGYWREGNDRALDRMLRVEFKRDYAQLYQRINVGRNQSWLPRLRALLDDEHSDDTLVVVGTMHLLGPDGLVSQLRARGYRVERL